MLLVQLPSVYLEYKNSQVLERKSKTPPEIECPSFNLFLKVPPPSPCHPHITMLFQGSDKE